jgi:hypothetical protein
MIGDAILEGERRRIVKMQIQPLTVVLKDNRVVKGDE